MTVSKVWEPHERRRHTEAVAAGDGDTSSDDYLIKSLRARESWHSTGPRKTEVTSRICLRTIEAMV